MQDEKTTNSEIRQYLELNKHNWHKYIDLQNKFGTSARNELNSLFKDGLIEVRMGINCKVVKLLSK